MNIAIDFDGTCVTHDFPSVGKDIGAVPVLKQIVDAGHNLILWTMRGDRYENGDTGHPSILNVTGEFLQDAIRWFDENDIPLWGIQTNPTQYKWTNSPKAFAHLYIDDAALGCPLTHNPEFHHRPYVNWVEVEKYLILNKII